MFSRSITLRFLTKTRQRGMAVRGTHTLRRLTVLFCLNLPEGCLNRDEKRHKKGRFYAEQSLKSLGAIGCNMTKVFQRNRLLNR